MLPDRSGGLLFAEWACLFLFVILGLGYKRRDPWTFSEIFVVSYVFLSIKLVLIDTSILGGLDTVGWGKNRCNKILVAAYIYIFNQKGTEESNPTLSAIFCRN